MSPHNTLSTLLLAAVLCHCGPRRFREERSTRVSRETLVVTHRPRADAYFAAVRGYQHALGTIDARRADLFADLSRTLGLLPNADRVDVAAAIRAAVLRAGASQVHVRGGLADDSHVAAVDAWHAALLAPTDERAVRDAIDARHAALASSITLTLELVSPATPTPRPAPAPDAGARDLGPLGEVLLRVLRDASATRLCMNRLTGARAPVLADEAGARADAPGHGAEFNEARRFVQSIQARATLHAQESAHDLRWLHDVLAPESEEDDDDETPSEKRRPKVDDVSH